MFEFIKLKHQKNYRIPKKKMEAGKRIGKYRILRTLGNGGTCKVKLGIDTESGQNVAVKIIKSDLG